MDNEKKCNFTDLNENVSSSISRIKEIYQNKVNRDDPLHYELMNSIKEINDRVDRQDDTIGKILNDIENLKRNQSR